MFLRHKHPERSQILAGYCAFGFPQLLSDGRLEVEILEVDGGGVDRFVLGSQGMFVGFHGRQHETVSTGVKRGASSSAVDPNLAAKLIMPANEATTKEIIETSQDIAKIFSGQVVNALEGANSQLRLQVVQQWIQGTPEIPAEDVQARMQEDEKFAQRIQTYVGQLEFMQTQQKNALVGQLGTAPGNVPGSAQQ